jgi:hypothetical protein
MLATVVRLFMFDLCFGTPLAQPHVVLAALAALFVCESLTPSALGLE